MVIYMNYYFAEQRPDELYHFGVKGMKWGVRKQRPVGNGMRRRSSWAQASQMARQANAQRRQAWKRSNVQNLSPREQKIRRRTRVAQGALIVAGSAMMGIALYKAAKSPQLYNARKYVQRKFFTNVEMPARNAFARGKAKYQIRRNALDRSRETFKKVVNAQEKALLPPKDAAWYRYNNVRRR